MNHLQVSTNIVAVVVVVVVVAVVQAGFEADLSGLEALRGDSATAGHHE